MESENGQASEGKLPVPTLDEVLKAGYSQEAAEGIIEHQKELLAQAQAVQDEIAAIAAQDASIQEADAAPAPAAAPVRKQVAGYVAYRTMYSFLCPGCGTQCVTPTPECQCGKCGALVTVTV